MCYIFCSRLNGIILNFKNIKIQPLTKLVEDGYVPVSCRADIYIFKPKINCVLKGKTCFNELLNI